MASPPLANQRGPASPCIAINGAAGRMGRQLLMAAAENTECQLTTAIEAPNNAAVGSSVALLAAELGDLTDLIVVSDAREVADSFNVIVDFTRPEATLDMLEKLDGSDTSFVIGTTGFTDQQRQTLEEASKRHPIVFASNYSAGVTLTLNLLATAAASLGDDYDVEIIEAHHRNKVDAPSGTALSMGESVARALGRDLGECAVYGRQGHTGVRDTKTIGFETVRAGDIIGDHTVLFAGQGERIEITHRATDRMTFARGAIRAACWLGDRPAGLYDMHDVLGLRK